MRQAASSCRPTGRDRSARACQPRLLREVVLGPARLRVEPCDHVVAHVGLRVDEPDVVLRALEEPQVPITARVHQPVDRASAAVEIKEQWRRDLVPVPRVVPVVLVVGDDASGCNVEGEHGVRVEIVARANIAEPWPGVACPPIGEAELRVVGAGDPDRNATGLP